MNLSSTLGIFGFDGDGIDTYGATGNSSDLTGYGGPEAYFSGINGSGTSGTVNFLNGGLAPLTETFFSLEEAPSLATGGVTATSAAPEPASLALAGIGAGCAFFGRLVRRRKQAVV
jgi:hypothetical protein